MYQREPKMRAADRALVGFAVVAAVIWLWWPLFLYSWNWWFK